MENQVEFDSSQGLSNRKVWESFHSLTRKGLRACGYRAGWEGPERDAMEEVVRKAYQLGFRTAQNTLSQHYALQAEAEIARFKREIVMRSDFKSKDFEIAQFQGN